MPTTAENPAAAADLWISSVDASVASCIVRTPPSSAGPSAGNWPFTTDSVFACAVPPALSVDPDPGSSPLPPKHPASRAAADSTAPALNTLFRMRNMPLSRHWVAAEALRAHRAVGHLWCRPH